MRLPDRGRPVPPVPIGLSRPVTTAASPYRSFWMGGFEGADHVNGLGQALDMSLSSGHLERLDEDYAAAVRFGLCSVRESVGWRLAETAPGRYDFTRLHRLAQAGRRHGVQIVWTLMHYGTPPDIDLHDDAMIDRFAAFAAAAAQEIAPACAEAPVYNLINEINFLAWAVSDTEMIHPYRDGDACERRGAASGYAVKRRLVRAVLAAVEAVRQVDPRARFLHIEPLLHVVPPADRPELQARADEVRSFQWQAWDLIAGRVEPALGGSLDALDLVGVNYYHSGQWEVETDKRLDWASRDPRRIRFSALLLEAWQRYRRPLVIAETSHVGSGRAAWLNEIADETATAREQGARVDGICLYPLVDRHDWSNPHHWHRSGLWDAGSDADPAPASEPQRLLQQEYAEALFAWQRRLPSAGVAATRQPVATLLVFSPRLGCERPALLQRLLVLARDHGHAVDIIEEPVTADGPAWLDRRPLAPGVAAWVPHTPLPAQGFDPRQARLIAPLLRQHGIGDGTQPLLAWLAAAGAETLARLLEPVATICDHSDAGTPWTPATGAGGELARDADLVLCAAGAPNPGSGSRQRLVVGAGVDLPAFDPRRLPTDSEEARAAAHLQRHIAAPCLGLFGPIDRGIDFRLLTELAERRPGWNFVVVGSWHGIEPQTLPRRPNLHRLGAQPYHRLGHFASGWDAVLLPLRSEGLPPSSHAPDQLLEALATTRPVVVSRLPAVVRRYGEYLATAEGPESWLQACEAALAESPTARDRRAETLLPLLEAASWEASAGAIAERLGELLSSLATGGRASAVGGR